MECEPEALLVTPCVVVSAIEALAERVPDRVPLWQPLRLPERVAVGDIEAERLKEEEPLGDADREALTQALRVRVPVPEAEGERDAGSVPL